MSSESKIRTIGTGALADFLGDVVVYRSLEPMDARLPGLGDLRGPLGIDDGRLPRKGDSDYGRVVAEMLQAAARIRSQSAAIESVIVLGDTQRNDVGTFLSLCAALDCPGGAFIGDETTAEAAMVVEERGPGRTVHRANRWRLIDVFESNLEERGIVIGEGSAVIVDIDKTALGARGRNDQPIDAARVAAVLSTARELRSGVVNEACVRAAYSHFNREVFHSFTGDNQDVVAYMAMIIEGGWGSRVELDEAVLGGRFVGFDDLLQSVSRTADRLPEGLRRAHREVVAAVENGDPTPFKEFRRFEFRETVDRMTPDAEHSDADALLASRIMLTGEVCTRATTWRDRGAVLLGLSDKPDEASFPSPALRAAGYQPVHRTVALMAGTV